MRKSLGGGQASVLRGMVLGIGSEVIKGSHIIWSRVGRLEGSFSRILVIRFFAFSEMLTCSGNWYLQSLILL